MKLSLVFAGALATLATLSGCAASTEPESASESDLTASREMVTQVTCTTKEKIDGAIEKMTFDLSSEKDVVAIEADDDLGEIYVKSSGDSEYVRSLNENYTSRLKDGKLRIHGDADGFFLVELVLYENSDFSKGFFRVYNNMDGEDMYSEVTCTKKQVKAPKIAEE